jgi:hypothetical protein
MLKPKKEKGMNIQSSQNSEYIISYLTLRQMIGWIGFFMPIVVRCGAYFFENVSQAETISAYYYTGMRDVFVSTLVLIGVLLSCYRTPRWHDNSVAIVAGIAAIGIGLFPMDPIFSPEILSEHQGMTKSMCYINRGILGYHLFFVSIFFSVSFYLVFFRFTAFTPENPTRQKRMRNRAYKICGLAMLIAFAIIGFKTQIQKVSDIFWPETLAVVSFAVAWLIKGQTILKDEIS